MTYSGFLFVAMQVTVPPRTLEAIGHLRKAYAFYSKPHRGTDPQQYRVMMKEARKHVLAFGRLCQECQ